MRHVVVVHPAVSWAVLSTGLALSLFFAWQAYTLFSSFSIPEVVWHETAR